MGGDTGSRVVVVENLVSTTRLYPVDRGGRRSQGQGRTDIVGAGGRDDMYRETTSGRTWESKVVTERGQTVPLCISRKS